MGMKITFLGAAGTVTGSRFLVECGKTTLLVDCGLFQGVKMLRLRNWKSLPFAPASLDAVVLTHAHIDHTGYLPALIRDGYAGKVHCTRGTRDLARIMLPDAGHLQEEDAYYANKRGYSKHHPALPLYTEEDARRSLDHLRPHELEKRFVIGELGVTFRRAGHILGAATVTLEGGGRSVMFSGDLGPYDHLVMYPPEPPGEHDLVVMESTYGDRMHSDHDPLLALEALLAPVLERGGVVLIPSFAVGRAQTLLFCIDQLISSRRLPRVPVFVNSPMATEVTGVYCDHHHEQRLSDEQCQSMVKLAHFVGSVEESKALNDRDGPMIIISASGMLTGGRVLHHMKSFAPDPDNLIVLPGFQAPGTRGAALADGAPEVKIHGQYVPVRARVEPLSVFSAHGDQGDLLRWIGSARRPPPRVILVHGEPAASDALRVKITDELKLRVDIAGDGEIVQV